MFHIVYQTTNIVNGKIYVGVHSTKNLEDGYLGSGTKLNLALKKYGKEIFSRKILHFCESREEAFKIEYEIVNSDFILREDTYNIDHGGNGCMFNRKHSTETIVKMKNRVFTEEHKAKLTASGLGRKLSKESHEKMRASAIKRCARGISHETRDKRRASNIGKTHSPETKAKISAGKTGKKLSEKTKNIRKVNMWLKRKCFVFNAIS